MTDEDANKAVPDGTFSELMSEEASPPVAREDEATNKRTNVNSQQVSNEPTKQPSNVLTNKRTMQQRKLRSKQPSSENSGYTINVPSARETIRASFDIFADQKVALNKLQVAAVDAGEKKPKLGDMLQQAIDVYVRKRARELGNVTVGRAAKKDN